MLPLLEQFTDILPALGFRMPICNPNLPLPMRLTSTHNTNQVVITVILLNTYQQHGTKNMLKQQINSQLTKSISHLWLNYNTT